MDMITLALSKAYTDKKTGYSEVKKVVVFPKTTFEGALDSNRYYEFTSGGPLDFPAIDISKPCVCIFDGVRYDCNVSGEAEGDLYPEYFTIGNRKMLGYSDSGQQDVPFCLYYEWDLWLYADTAGEHTLEIYQETETIHTIDQKYLPNKVVDFDALGLSNHILQLFNTGGGSVSVGSGNLADIEPICKAFPLNGDYIAKMTIEDMGIMNIAPVYTLVNEDGFKTAHFDSYINMGNGLTKFYVRIIRAPVNSGGVFIDIEVGFYQ